MTTKKISTKTVCTSRALLASLPICCALAPLLMAQTVAAESNSAGAVEEVVITASKRNQTLKDFPGSVTVVPGDTLNPNATISDVANQVPGLTVTNIGPRNSAALIIRGLRTDQLGSNDFAGDGSTVTTYVDNVPLQGFFVPPSIGLKDLQQIEVLRGPQGTLYGNASVGGLIRYVTAKPDLTKNTVAINAAVSQTAESSSFNYDTDLVVNTPLIDNTLGVRLLLGKQSNAGFIDNKSLLSGKKDDINSDQTTQLRATILWKPTDEFSLTSGYNYQKINADDRQASNESVTGDKYTASNKYLQPMEGDLRLSSVDAVYDFGWATLTASASRYDYTTKTQADQTDFLLHTYGEGYYAEDPNFSAFRRGDVDVVKNSGELRLVSPNDQPLRWLVGAFVSTDDLDVAIADYVPGFYKTFDEKRPHDLDYLFSQTEKLREQSVYTEVAYDVKPQWEVSVGARHFRYKDALASCSLVFPARTEYVGDNYPLACSNDDDDQSGYLSKFSTKYKFNQHQNIYFTVAEGFRRGGANLLPVEVNHNRSYKPDTVTNYEIGSHSDFMDGKIEFNGSLFYMDWKKIQVSATTEEGYGITANAGTARSKGVELETLTQLNEAWSARLSYTFTDAALTESVVIISNEGDTINAHSGDRLTGAPKHQWNLGLNYQQAIKTATLFAGINYAYSSDTTTALNKSFADYAHLNGYSMVNAHVDVSLRNMSFGLFVNNMGNTHAVTGKRTTTFYGANGQFDYITRPRTLGLKASYQF
jgi:iron complex outermembrane receptor protein